MAITLKEKSILNEWSVIVDHAADHAQGVVDDIQKRIRESMIPGGCSLSVVEVASSGFFSKVRRDLLIVNLEEFKDYHVYIGVRKYGIHLDCCRFLTVEPGLFKTLISEKLTGSADALSAPKNILIHQDLRAWATVVHHAVIDSVNGLVTKLGKDPSMIQRGSKGFLEIW